MAKYKSAKHPVSGSVVTEHILVAEKALGRRLPKGAEIHHIDYDGRNNSPGNLVICESRSYHHLLHVRQTILEAKGNPDTDKICRQCNQALHRSLFSKNSFAVDGLRQHCRSCDRVVQGRNNGEAN